MFFNLGRLGPALCNYIFKISKKRRYIRFFTFISMTVFFPAYYVANGTAAGPRGAGGSKTPRRRDSKKVPSLEHKRIDSQRSYDLQLQPLWHGFGPALWMCWGRGGRLRVNVNTPTDHSATHNPSSQKSTSQKPNLIHTLCSVVRLYCQHSSI